MRADRIIAVTFTNDAAAELKKRLDKKLREMIEINPDNAYLLRQQVLLQNAKISTINSFCFELLRDNITNQGITSGFGILDENDEGVIKSQAMDELLDFYSNEEYEKISQLYDKFCVKNQNPLISAVQTADKFLSSVAFSSKWLDKAVSEYQKPFEQSIYYEALFENIIKNLQTAVKLAQDNLSSVRHIFPDMTVQQAKDSETQSACELEKAELMLKIAESHRFPTDNERTAIIKFERLITVNKKVPHNMALREIFKARRDKLKNILVSAVNSLSSAKSDYEESASATALLCEAVKKYREIIWEKKCSKNAVSFDDGERLVLELLADFDEEGNIIQSEIARRTADFYDIIMIDEYQDSNNKQDMIFKLLSKNYRNGRYGTNAFLVGDVKQSIYRFRLANPKNFIKVMDCAELYSGETTAENHSILLNKNFRSSREVIDFVNFVFGGIMTRECGDIDYTKDEELSFGASQYDKYPEINRRTRINLINTDEDEPEDENNPESEISENIEAEITAGKIADMIKNGVPVTESDGSVRPCTPKDFCILVRKNNYTNIYVKALEKHGISAKGSDEKGYLKSQEIAVLTDLLRIIANPLQDIPMAAVMVSPMYPFKISDLAYIKTFGCKTPLFTLLKQIVGGEFEDFDVSLAEQCRQFIESVDRFRINSITMTIGELINMIYDETDFISVMEQYIDGDRKRANLRILIQYARNYESLASADGSGGLSGFIRHIDRVIEKGDYNQGGVSASSGDYVIVQTFHKSKGLEYPFVFIAETSTRFKFDSNNVMCSDDGRIGFILYDKSLVRKYKTFQQIMLCNEGQRDSRSEEMRLLYVGLTRARQQLFINLRCGEEAKKRINSLISECIVDGNNIENLVSKAISFSDWFWLCLMMHCDFPEIAELAG
ncbi:MAG: UvrD-helicase domain-containing protein, partial [Ruminococcus sp.]|nr:UvrD-helicase domain-containing protein [Ruminococcus sp.]